MKSNKPTPKQPSTPPLRGLVIGKFYPPHRGHSYLIETALSHADTVDVLVCDHPDYRIPATRRAEWLATLHPKATIQIIEDIEQEENSEAWAAHTASFLGYTPDVVFSSEDYGYAYAAYLNAKHHLVDKERQHVPISARQIRPNVHAKWEFLQPAVRAQFAKRICVLGAESTGTTTLAQALASHYKAPWVPEYGRYYTESFLGQKTSWNATEFTHIAQMQQAMERELAGNSDGLIICDTNAFATRLWHERYLGFMSDAVDAVAANDRVDLYIITDDSIPFVQDGIRDGENIRHEMHMRFVEEVIYTGIPYIVTSGTVPQRIMQAAKIINTILREKITI